jgi:polyphosphate kinase 2
MVVIRDGKLRPVQVSSRQKENPMFFKYQDTDCDCMAVYKGRNGRWRVDTLLSENKEGLINVLSSNDIDPSEMDDLLSQLPDEEVTDLAVRNLERKFLKSGNPRTNARKYLEKLVNSVKNREDIEDEDDDYDVEDEFVYGGEEPEKSSIGKKRFKRELLPLQAELLKLQEHIKETGKSIAVVFEGRDTAGKGSTIRTITKYLDPKYFNVVALGIPTPEERKNWFGRYEKFIEPGKITFFDRSWYNRGIVEPVMGYGEEGDYEEFLNTVNDFEKSLVSKGVDLYKFWLSITPKTQQKRFDLRKSSPLKYWKYSPNDEKSLEKWDDYTEYKQRVFDLSKGEVPWTVVDTNDKRIGSLNLLRHILKNSDYPDKNEGTIGDTYPESITTINENFIDDMKPLLPILQSDDSGHIFNFLIALRDSGIVNMMQSPDFTWSGRDFLDKYLKIQELQDSYQQIEDEDEKENLLQLAEKSQQVMISAAFRNLQDKEQELSTNNINRELRKLGPLALRYFMMKL